MGFHMLNEASLNGVDGSILFEAVSQDINRALDEMLGAEKSFIWQVMLWAIDPYIIYTIMVVFIFQLYWIR